MVVTKPTDINNWVVWGDATESVLKKLDLDIWDKEQKKYFVEIEHKPTSLMRYEHQIEDSKDTDYDRVKDVYRRKFPMDMILYLQPRTEGTYIIMLCNYKGNPTGIIEKINKNIWEENQRLRKELKDLKSWIVREQALLTLMAKHPLQFEKLLVKRQMLLRKGTAPAYVSGKELEPEIEEET